MFGPGSLGRAAAISLVLAGIAAVLIIEFGPNQSIGFMRIKVINDTAQTVKVQPCWDIDCLQRNGLAATIVPPHRTPIVASKWPDDVWNQVAIGVVKPKTVLAGPPAHCVIGLFPPHTAVGVVRVSEQTLVRCPQLGEGGGGGTG